MGSSDSESELFDTQTPNPSSSLESQEVHRVEPAWGRLFPTVMYLPPMDLNKQCVLLGRSADCDVILSKNNFSPNSLRTVSKKHFMISRGEEGQSAYICDFSKNGTFINGRAIGNGRKIILGNDDEIAIGTTRHTIYVYKTIDSELSSYLPPELKYKYEISRLLGSGACGEVRLAFEKTTFEKYAIKKVKKAQMDVKTMLNNPIRIQNEVQILQSLSHPCVISTKEIAETDEAVFIVLEYMEGGELTDLLQSLEHPLPESKIKLIFYQIVLGLQYLHEQGITHRDLKPGNVLLSSSDSETLVKISDFGLSKMIHGSTCMTTICGTPLFVSPEIIDPKYTQYTKQIDIWSLGVILFYMLSNELPFKAESDCQSDLFRLILAGKYSMNQKAWNLVSDDAKDLVRKMLIRNPEQRITVDGILKHPWISKDSEMQKKAKNLMYKDSDEDFRDVKRPRLDTSLP